MSQNDNYEPLVEKLKELKKLVSDYLDTYVSNPALETVIEDIEGQADIANQIILVDKVINYIKKSGISYDREFLSGLPKEEIEDRIKVLSRYIELEELEGNSSPHNDEIIDKAAEYLSGGSSKKYLLEYFARQMHWINISILSASYISALILMRSTFELIVGIATIKNGSMSDRIKAIAILSLEEKSEIKKLWNHLCAWSHPYGKWAKEVCPVFLQYDPMYHSELFNVCLKKLNKLTDFFLVISMSKYDLDAVELSLLLGDSRIKVDRYKMFQSRLQAV